MRSWRRKLIASLLFIPLATFAQSSSADKTESFVYLFHVLNAKSNFLNAAPDALKNNQEAFSIYTQAVESISDEDLRAASAPIFSVAFDESEAKQCHQLVNSPSAKKLHAISAKLKPTSLADLLDSSGPDRDEVKALLQSECLQKTLDNFGQPSIIRAIQLHISERFCPMALHGSVDLVNMARTSKFCQLVGVRR